MRVIPWLSILLLLLANIAFGTFLHERPMSLFLWGLTITYVVLECGILSVVWHPIRDLLLLGFQSDVGYSIMALAGASFAVIILVWAKFSSYFLLMIAAALLLRINLYTRRIGSMLSFVIMVIVSLMGIGISWLPVWLIPSG
ncbi:MAG: hypothetical protein WA783_10605 [Phormidesmis sp.]